MLKNADIEVNGLEQISQPEEWQQLAQENGSLRKIIVELLIKNQNLRWELSSKGSRPVQDPKVFMASEGTPFRKKSRTAGMP